MAFPSSSTPVDSGALNGTSQDITLASHTTGDRLLVSYVIDGGASTYSSHTAGWDILINETDTQAAITLMVFEKIAASASETLTITLSANRNARAIARTITGSDTATAGSAQVANSSGSPSTTADPPSVTPAWGSADTLWVTFAAFDNSTRTVSSYPTNYSNTQLEAGSGVSSTPRLATAARELAATSEDPGAYTFSDADQWVAATVAIKPAGGGGGATAVTLTGPSSGVVGVASTNFTVGANGTITGTVTVTPNDGGDGGSFSPTSVAISSGTPTATFTYTPANVGAPTATISVTNDGGLSNPAGIDYTATAAPTGPTIDTQPSNQTVTEPATATFTVAATTSGGSLSYQWQRNPGGVGSWANVTTGTGGTTASYTTAATTESGGDANNADQFRCLVTDDNGTTTSSAATLTVNAAASNNVRLAIGIYGERGGQFASQTVVRWRVFSVDGATLHHTGTTGTTSAAGVLTIDINSAAFNVGDDVEFEVVFHDGATDPLDRTVTVVGGYITAAAQV